MTTKTRELYASPNSDRWLLARQADSHEVYVLHIANAASGGHRTQIDLGAFLYRPGNTPEQQALWELIATLADVPSDVE
jgi:hypothetical protein